MCAAVSPVIVECCARLCPGLGSGTDSTLGTAIPCAHPGTAVGERCQTGTAGAGTVPLMALCLWHHMPATCTSATLGPGVPSRWLWGAGCVSALLSIPPLLPLPIDPERGAGTGRAPMPETTGQQQTEAELLPFPGTPVRTAEAPSPQGSPAGPWAGREGTGPTVQDGAAIEHPGAPLSAGTAEQAAAGSEPPSPASLGVTSVGPPAPMEPDTAPTTRYPPGTDPVGNVTAEGATTPQRIPSYSPSSMTVPGSARGQRGSPSTLPGWTPMGTALVQSQRGSRSPLSPELWAVEGLGATIPLGDSSPGTHSSITLATDSPAPGTIGMSPFAGGLQRLMTPTGPLGGTLRPAGRRGSDSRPWHGMDVAWQGPRSAPRPSPSSLGTGGLGGPVASTAQPATGMGSTLLPAAGKGSSLPVPSTTASTAGVTSPGLGGALDLTTRVLGPPNKESPPEHSQVPLDQTWHLPAMLGQPPTSVAPGSSAGVQSRVPYTTPGSPHIPLFPQPAPTSGSSVPTLPTPQPSPGTGWGVLGVRPTVGTHPGGPFPGVRLRHASSGGDPAESPQVLGGTAVGVGDAGSWAATAPLSWQQGSLAPPSAAGPPRQPAPSQPASSLGPTTDIGVTATAVTATAVTTTTTITAATASPPLLGDVGTVMPEPGAAVLQSDVAGLMWESPTHLPTVMPGPPQQPTDPPGTLGHRGGPGSPPAATDTDLVQLSSSPRGWLDADTPQATPAAAGRAPRVFIVEDQPPLLRGGSGGFGTLCWGRVGGRGDKGAISMWGGEGVVSVVAAPRGGQCRSMSC